MHNIHYTYHLCSSRAERNPCNTRWTKCSLGHSNSPGRGDWNLHMFYSCYSPGMILQIYTCICNSGIASYTAITSRCQADIMAYMCLFCIQCYHIVMFDLPCMRFFLALRYAPNKKWRNLVASRSQSYSCDKCSIRVHWLCEIRNLLYLYIYLGINLIY